MEHHDEQLIGNGYGHTGKSLMLKETKKKKAKVDTIQISNGNTLTQCGGGFFDENAERHPILDNQFTQYGHTYIKGDVFHRIDDGQTQLVTIEGFKKDLSIVYATLKAEYYIQLEDTYIGTEEATVVGNGLYVKRISSSPMKTRLSLLGERRNTAMDPIHFKYIYTGKQGKEICCYKSINTNSKVSKPCIRCPNGEIPFGNTYAGGGGVDRGYQEAGFHCTFSVDSDTASCSTLQANFPKSAVHQRTVKDFLIGCIRNPDSSAYPKVGSIMLLHGSTPCQGFSLANRGGGFNDNVNNQETYQFMDAVEYFSPPFVTFENVEGIKTEDNKVYLQKMISRFLSLGYQARGCTLNAADYGDPQIRKRVIIFAAKDGLELPEVPPPTHGKGRHLLPYRTAGDTLGFLENINPLDFNGCIEATYNGSTVAMVGHVLKTAAVTDDDKYLTKDDPVPTILKQRTIRHYANMQRPLTRLERSLLQGFPPTHKFYGTDKEIHDQIGNAVPVGLASAIGRSVMDAIRKSYPQSFTTSG